MQVLFLVYNLFMEDFGKKEYSKPEDLSVDLGVQANEVQKGPVFGKDREQMEREIQEGIDFFEKIDKISRKDDFQGEIDYVQKYKEFEENLKNKNIEQELEFKIYILNIKNLIDCHKKAIDIIVEKEATRKPGESPSPDELFYKAEEINERKAILNRYLYDLKNLEMGTF